MAKAIPLKNPSQGSAPRSAALCGSQRTSFTPFHCGYSVIGGLVYDHLAGDFWFPGDPLLLGFQTDYAMLVADIRRSRRELRWELIAPIGPRRRREIRAQRDILRQAQFYFETASMLADVDATAGETG